MEQYKYYSTQRPIDIGTYPKSAENPLIEYTNFAERLPMENGAFKAWGVLIYAKPLTEKEIRDYELRPCRMNPDIWPVMLEQTQFVARWERRNRIPKEMRLTQRSDNTMDFVPRNTVLPERISERYKIAKSLPYISIPQRSGRGAKQPQER